MQYSSGEDHIQDNGMPSMELFKHKGFFTSAYETVCKLQWPGYAPSVFDIDITCEKPLTRVRVGQIIAQKFARFIEVRALYTMLPSLMSELIFAKFAVLGSPRSYLHPTHVWDRRGWHPP